MEDIQPSELISRRANGENIFVLDVREEFEFEERNIGGKLIPLGSLLDRLEELNEYKDQEFVVHCRSGARSATAKKLLESKGFTKVRNLLGGILAYNG